MSCSPAYSPVPPLTPFGGAWKSTAYSWTMLSRLTVSLATPRGAKQLSRHRNPLERTDFTLASSMNLRQRSEASMRIDAAATQPVFGGLCHLLMPIAGRVIKRPIKKRPRNPVEGPRRTDAGSGKIRAPEAPDQRNGPVEKVAGTTTRCAASIQQTAISCAYADFFNRPERFLGLATTAASGRPAPKRWPAKWHEPARQPPARSDAASS